MNINELELISSIAKFLFEKYGFEHFSFQSLEYESFYTCLETTNQQTEVEIIFMDTKTIINLQISNYSIIEFNRKFKTEKGAKRIINNFFRKNKVLTREERLIKDIIE
jgi:hypothetical protein